MARLFPKIGIILALFAVVLPTQSYAKNEKTYSTLTDIGAIGLATVAFGTPLIKGDTNGAIQAAGSMAATELITLGLKETFPETRPDGSDRKSFPSGHTALSFAAAATLYNREGQDIGIPAFVVAGLVGAGRVAADKHFWHDVAVGAAIGTASGFLITRDRPSRSAVIIPWGDTKGGGIAIAARF